MSTEMDATGRLLLEHYKGTLREAGYPVLRFEEMYGYPEALSEDNSAVTEQQVAVQKYLKELAAVETQFEKEITMVEMDFEKKISANMALHHVIQQIFCLVLLVCVQVGKRIIHYKVVAVV